MKIINLPFDRSTDKGISLYGLGHYDEAIAILSKAIRKDSQAVVAYYYRGLSKYALNQFEEAIANYDRAIALASDYDEIYEKRGLARLALRQYELAIYDCNEAIRINLYNANAFEVRGTAKIKSGDAISGSEDIDKARQLRARWEVGVVNSSLKDVPIRSSVSHARINNFG